MMNRAKLAHVVRAVAAITEHKHFVIVGSATVLLQARNIPAAMLNTNEIDIYSPDAQDEEFFADLVEGSIGPGSHFDRTFKYHGDGVSSRTASLPSDWRGRASLVTNLGIADVEVVVPDLNDIALAKMVAWREKDRDWLKAGVRALILSPTAMRERAPRLPAMETPADEIERRLTIVAGYGGSAPQLN